MSCKEEVEAPGRDQESGECLLNEKEGEAENLSGQSEESDKKSIQVKMSETI